MRISLKTSDILKAVANELEQKEGYKVGKPKEIIISDGKNEHWFNSYDDISIFFEVNEQDAVNEFTSKSSKNDFWDKAGKELAKGINKKE